MTHYCEWARDDTRDNNPKEDNLEDGAPHLEELETKLLKDDDEEDDEATTTMPPPSSSSSARVPQSLPLMPPPPSTSSSGGHVCAFWFWFWPWLSNYVGGDSR